MYKQRLRRQIHAAQALDHRHNTYKSCRKSTVQKGFSRSPVHELPTLPEHCRGIGTRPVNPAGDPEPPGTRRRDLETSHSRRRGRAHAYCSRRHARARASATRSHTCSCGTLQHTSTEASERKDSASASSINGRLSLLHMPHKHPREHRAVYCTICVRSWGAARPRPVEPLPTLHGGYGRDRGEAVAGLQAQSVGRACCCAVLCVIFCGILHSS